MEMNPRLDGSPSPLVIFVFWFVGIIGWAFYLGAFHLDPFQDWAVFYTAARAYLDGNLALLAHGDAFTEALNQRFAGWFAVPLDLHPWVYPPSFLALLLPFGLLPPAASLLVFMLFGFGALLAAVWFCTKRGCSRWLSVHSLFLCPAVAFNVMTGQNAFYTSALLLGGFELVARRPVIGGALLGAVSFKPQLWLMVPVALIAGRAWRALASVGTVAVGLAAAGLAVAGPTSWRAWLELATGNGTLYHNWLMAGRLKGQSVFACATLLGAPNELADLAQWIAIAAAAGFVYWTFCHDAPKPLRLAMLLAATMLAAPHVSASDAVLLALAASLFLSALAAAGNPTPDTALALALWVSPLFNPPVVFPPGLATPVLLLAFMTRIALSIRRTAGATGDRTETDDPGGRIGAAGASVSID